MPRSRKDPQDIDILAFRWEPWLHGATISSSVWTTEPATGLTLSNQVFTAVDTSVFLSSGTLGVQYKVTNHITTSDGRELTWSRQVLIEKK